MELKLGMGLIRTGRSQARRRPARTNNQRVRQTLAAEIRIILPKIRVRDNMRLEQNHYRIKIADMAVAQGFVWTQKVLDPGNTLADAFERDGPRARRRTAYPRCREASARRASPNVAGRGQRVDPRPS